MSRVGRSLEQLRGGLRDVGPVERAGQLVQPLVQFRELAHALADRDEIDLRLFAHSLARARRAIVPPRRARLYRLPIPGKAGPMLARAGLGADALVGGEMVKISSFGSFSIRQKGERVGRNPKTGDEVPILPRRVLVFRASHVLKNRINRSLLSLTG